jgi:hydroxypyruvate reductase
VLERIGRAGKEDKIIHLISGGGSALLAAPLRPLVSARDKVELHRLLVDSGLGIREINVVRKRFSAIKGGRLLLRGSKARHLSLILSDVPEGAPELVAGGPTLPDPSSQEECHRILEESGILEALPIALQLRLQRRGLPELPRPSDRRFLSHRWTVLATSADLVEAAASRARQLGYSVRVLPGPIENPVEQALDRIMAERDRLRETTEGPRCVVAGGEVRVRTGIRKGEGGRAQELAAAAGERLEGIPGCVFLASGSDGVDGNSPAAGAVSDGGSVQRARRKGLDPQSLRRSGDTYRLFQALGDSLVTGPTENNLRDLYLLMEASGRAGSLKTRVATGDRRGS